MIGSHRAALAAVLILTVVAYHGVVGNAFVWDDVHTIVNNRAIDSLADAPRWFTKPETGSALRDANYRPVLVASFAADVALWGRRPGGFHAVNVAIHLGVILLAYLLALRAWVRTSSALAAAFLVALHPINAEAVNYVSARSSLLSTLFVLSSIAAWDAARTRRRPAVWVAASLTLGLLALGVKESAVILPLLILTWDRLTSPGDTPWTASFRRSLPWWGLVAAYLIWRSAILSGSSPAELIGDGPWQGIFFALKIFLASLWSWFVPIGWALDHGWAWRVGPGEGAVLVAGGLVAGALTLATFRVDRRIGWCAIWFWASLLPLAALPWVSRLTLYQDHRVYLAGIGPALATGEVVRRLGVWCAAKRPAAIAAGLLAVVATAAAVRTDVVRTTMWRDAERLWAHTVARYPSSVLGQNHIALRRLEAGDVALAREQFEASVALAPDFPLTHNYLGIAYARLGKLDLAIEEFTTAVRLSPFYTGARLNLGNAYEKAGRPDLALVAYESGVPDAPWTIELIERAGKLLERMGRPDEAQAHYRRILAIEPDHHGARSRLDEASP